MPSWCASISMTWWRRKRPPRRRRLPLPRPSPRRRVRLPPLLPDLRPLLPPPSLPRLRQPLRRPPQVPRPNRPLLRPLLPSRGLFRHVRLTSRHLPFMRLRHPRIQLLILLRLQSPASLRLRQLRHPLLRQDPAHQSLSGRPLPQDPRVLRDNRARRIHSGPPRHLPDSVRQAQDRLLPRSDTLRGPAVLPAQDKGVPGSHRVTVPAADPAAHRVPEVRSVPAALPGDFRSDREIAPIKVRSAASVPAQEFPRPSRASRSMRASRRRAGVR